MGIAIKIENLSKQYRLGLVSGRTLSHDINRLWQTRIRRREDPYLKISESNIGNLRGESEYVWALKDINLEVEVGEVLGIIGKNGAGKSTLLKILSRVTAPTTGIIKARGRIVSLLEVGTGFHQEMTGRENIFLNGAILGMTKAEIRSRLEEIVDFAGVERYIDTPVKRYSSGMMVRLGFAVAAHMEPEILVVDEVLAVGDAEFQRKAVGKMQDVSRKDKRTVLFVSHNMGSVGDLCTRGIILKNGNIEKAGSIGEIIDIYLKSGQNIDTIREWGNITTAPGNELIKIRRISTVNRNREILQYTLTKDTFGIYLEYELLCDMQYFTHGVNLFNSSGIHIFSSHDSNQYNKNVTLVKGTYFTIAWVPGNLLQPGDYLVSIAFMRYNPFIVLFHQQDLLRIQIIDTKINSSNPEDCKKDLPGLIKPKLNWEQRVLNE